MTTVPLPEVDLPAEQRKITRCSLAAFALCALVLGASYLLLPRYVDFPSGLAERLAFVLRRDVER